jgi:hypothetical protein
MTLARFLERVMIGHAGMHLPGIERELAGASERRPVMRTQIQPAEQPITPAGALLQLMTGFWTTQAIYVAAKLGIADLLTGGSRSAVELAVETGADASSLYRLLRALASVGVLTEDEDATFALTPMGDCLRTGVPGSLRARAICGGEEWYRAWGDLLHSVKTGEVAFEHTFGLPFFSYLDRHADAATVFNAAMSGSTIEVAHAVAAAYDFGDAATIIDIGGGHGTLLGTILQANPHARGVLFDAPAVAASAQQSLAAAGLAARCTVAGGDFFATVPDGGDVYLLSFIIHDWDDERSIAILKNCRRAVGETGKLLLVEQVLPPRNVQSLSVLYDLHMMVLLGGHERTGAEYRALLSASGFALTRVIATQSPRSIIEAVTQ